MDSIYYISRTMDMISFLLISWLIFRADWTGQDSVVVVGFEKHVQSCILSVLVHVV